MYHVLICEDNAADAAKISELTDGLLRDICKEYKITIVSSASELLKMFTDSPDTYHLILMDILMDAPNGLQAARRLRQDGHNISIIFITVSPDFAINGYEVRALGYLVKPVDGEKLRPLLERDYNENYQYRYLLLQKRAHLLRIAVSEVVYLETVGRRTAVYLMNAPEPIMQFEPLDNLIARLPESKFAKCHKSFAVNLEHAKELRRYALTMTTGIEVPVSKAYYNEVKQRLLKSLNLI